MRNAEETLVILLKHVSAQEILEHEIIYDQWQEEEFIKFAAEYLKRYTEGECRLLYHCLQEYTTDSETLPKRSRRRSGLNPFHLIFFLVRNLLLISDNRLEVHYEKLLEWRRLTVQLSEDIFTCAYLAVMGRHGNQTWDSWCWDAVIGHNNQRLNRLLEQGISENHFHLWASAPYFQLYWVVMMNHEKGPGGYEALFQEMDRRKQYVNYNLDEKHGNVPYRVQCLQAMLIRAYLYTWLTGAVLDIGEYDIAVREVQDQMDRMGGTGETDRRKQEKWEHLRERKHNGFISLKAIKELVPEGWYRRQYRVKTYGRVRTLLESSWNIEAYQPEILSAIAALREFGPGKEDYVSLSLEAAEHLSDAERIYCSERWFLCRMFQKIFSDGAAYREEYNWFYAYLVIKEHIRSELVQANDRIGFLNFQRYSRRKNKGLPATKTDYAGKMALQNTLRSPRLLSLEARIAPCDTAPENRDYIRMLDGLLEPEYKERCFYVFHFAKTEDKTPAIMQDIACRHYEKRKRLKKQAEELIRFRERYPETAKRVKGIDACSYEIGCRPEVFAQAFRYLRGHVLRIEGWDGVEVVPQLRVTYHVGEDYLDMADGLRAIDEAVRFLELDCGDRLGHAIALGYDPERWYREKNYKILLTEQDYIDNVAWMYGRIVEFKIMGQEALLHYLEKEFEYHFRRVYGHSIFRENRNFTILTYYYAQRLRGDCPEYYWERRCRRPENCEETYYDYALLRKGMEREHYREIPEVVILYYLYHYDRDVKQAGARALEADISRQWIRGIAALQKKMQSYVAMRGIGIETNPSSNVMISGLQKYDEHPIIRFYNQHLVSDQRQPEECAQLSVSINTDDKGIFSTSLENEYALMACALEQSKDDDDNYLYSKTVVYEWLDRIREFGNQQTFGDIPQNNKNNKATKNPSENAKVIENPSDILIK